MADQNNAAQPPNDLPTLAYRMGIIEPKVDGIIKEVHEDYVKKTDGKFIRNIGALVVTTVITVLVTLFAKFIFSGGLG